MSQICSCESGDGRAETVPDYHELVLGVFGEGWGEDRGDVVADVGPGAPEAELGFAACAEFGVRVDEGCVGEPVPDGVGAPEGQDDGFVGCVDGEEAGCVGGSGAEGLG